MSAASSEMKKSKQNSDEEHQLKIKDLIEKSGT